MGRSLLADAIKYVKDCVRYIIRKKRGERGEGGSVSFFIGVRELFVEKAATPGHVEQVVGGATLPGGVGPLEGRRRRRREREKKRGRTDKCKEKGRKCVRGRCMGDRHTWVPKWIRLTPSKSCGLIWKNPKGVERPPAARGFGGV